MSENPIFSYTRRDYEGSRKEGLSKIPRLSKGLWTDLNATDPGVIMLDYVHALVDMMNYYQDHQALEAFISTAKERANIFRLAKQLSYKVRSAKGAVVTVEFSSPVVRTYVLEIPKYTRISTLSNIPYLTREAAYILPGETSVSVDCVQGELHTVIYKGTGVSRFSTISNAGNQSFKIVDSNVDIDTIVVQDSLGRTWTPVDYISFTTSEDRVYQIDLNPDDTVIIRFGDGERGVVPQETDLFTISYMTTLASEGNISARDISRVDSTIRGSDNQRIDIKVVNYSASTGGSSSQSSREIREIAPGVIKSQDRAVTLSDFEYLAKLVPGVSEVKAYDINTDPDLLHYEIKLLVTPDEGVVSSEALLKDVENYISSRMIPTTTLIVKSPVERSINLTITVKKLDSVATDNLRYSIQRAIDEYFSERGKFIGDSFEPSELQSKILSVQGVRSVRIDPYDTITVDSNAILTKGTIDIVVL